MAASGGWTGRRTRRGALGVGAGIGGPAWGPWGPAAPRGAGRGGQAGGAGGDVAPAGTPRKGTTIQWAVDSGPTRTPLREEQVQLFKAQFPDLNVEYVQGATGTEKLQALFAAGTPPDIFRQETAGMAYFASRGQLTGLDPYLRRDRYDLSDFFPAAWELWSWKGRHLGVPFMGIRVAYYHRGLADRAAVRRPPATWKDPGLDVRGLPGRLP